MPKGHMVSEIKRQHLIKIGLKKGHHIGLGVKKSDEHVKKVVETKQKNLWWRRIIRKYTKVNKMTARQETLHTIDRHNLSSKFIGKLTGLSDTTVKKYTSGKKTSELVNKIIEDKVLKWKEDLVYKRDILLAYGYKKGLSTLDSSREI